MKKLIGLTSILLTTGLAVLADPVTPTYTSIGSISGATFGGSGNPDTDVTITTIANGGNTITLGLQAQQRYFNPPVTDNGAGIYYAPPGQNNGLGSSSYQGATWNFDFYFNATGGSYTYKLFYGTDASSLISINPALIGDNASTPNSGGQNSENLLFGAWGNLSSYVLNGLSFDPNANAIYSFELVAYDSSGDAIGDSAINVDVGTVPDVASTAWLLGLGFLSLAAFGFRQNRLQAAK